MSSLQLPSEHVVFGEFLRQAREASGLTLQQVAQVTKIPRRHLEALEDGNLTTVPDPTYRRGEVRAYAEAVRVNPKVALARLEYALRTGGVTLTAASTAATPSRPLPLWLTGSVAVIAVAAVAYILLFRFDWRQRGLESAAVTTGAVDAPASNTPSEVAPNSPVDATNPSRSEAPVPPPRAPAEVAASSTPEPVPPPEPAVPAALPAAPPVSNPATSDGSILSGVQPSTEPASEEQQDTNPGSIGATVPPAAPNVRGGLEVISEPAGARVTVNGVGWGSTPLTLAQLPPGRHVVRISLAGYAAEERIVSLVEGGRRVQVSVELRPIL